jgi:hypothetical protein
MRSQRAAASAVAASAAATAAAASSAARLSREAELEERMLRQQQESLASDGRGWEPHDWRWRPLVEGGGCGAESPDATAADAEAEAAIAAYARATDDLEAPLRGLRLMIPQGGGDDNESSPPLALLAFLRRGLDEACARALEEEEKRKGDGAHNDALRVLVLGGGAPLALAASAAAKQAGWHGCSTVLVEPSPWGRRAAEDLLDAAADADDEAAVNPSSFSFAVVASPAQAAEGGGWAQCDSAATTAAAAHVVVTDLFCSGAVAMPPAPPPPTPPPSPPSSRPADPSSSCCCYGGAGGSPFALGLLGALRAAAACGAIDSSKGRTPTALVPRALRLHVALAGASLAPDPAVTRGVDLCPALDRAYLWAPPGSGGLVSRQGPGGRVRALSAPFVAAEVDLARAAAAGRGGGDGGAASAPLLACTTTRVDAVVSGDEDHVSECNACLVWTEPVLSAADGGGGGGARLSPPMPLPAERAALWLPPHRPLPLRKGDALMVRATVAAGRSAALALEFADADADDDDDDEAEDHDSNAGAVVVARPSLPPLPLDRPRCGALLPSWHAEMISDAERNAAYDRAIRRAVERVAPEKSGGCAPLPPPRVLDVGAGSGLLSILAAR